LACTPSANAQAAAPAQGAPAGQAQLQSGSIFYTNNGNVVQLTPSGATSNYGTGYNAPIGLAFDSQGNLYVENYGDGTIVQETPSGVSTTVASGFPALALNSGLAVDAAGNLFVAMQDLSDESQGSIVEVAPDGSTSTFVSGLNYPISVIFDPSGNLLMVANGEVEKVTPGGVVSTYTSSVPNPIGIALDPVGNLFVSDFVDGTVYEVAPGGATSLYASGLGTPYAIAVDAGENLFVVNSADQSVIQIAPNGARATVATGGAGGFIAASPIPPTPEYFFTTVAGNSGDIGDVDGLGYSAQFYYPNGLLAAPGGKIYVADTYNRTIRVDLEAGASPPDAGIVSTLAGVAMAAGNDDGTCARQGRLQFLCRRLGRRRDPRGHARRHRHDDCGPGQ
jgi:sugar lactone lactonase YvrE